ncbi:hypothetical protein B0H63DRAFT_221754 [Podospora didyma]|uniref:MADS-box domain-containing protein n=1 Tax=Podospora didyma TaxID=330526 RepID=A0AAE0KJ89_9PEZI|nr:hypothetical protein B0H63DRAFT_221754 [Podospora didyma]
MDNSCEMLQQAVIDTNQPLTPEKLKQLRNKRNKRRQTLFRKGDELRMCGARIYLLVEMNNKRYIYNSGPGWPPAPEKIMKESYPLPIQYGPGSFRKDEVKGKGGIPDNFPPPDP